MSQSMNLSFLLTLGRAWLAALHISEKQDTHARRDYIFGQILSAVNPAYYCGGHPPPGGAIRRAGMSSFNAFVGSAMDNAAALKNLDFTDGVKRFRQLLFALAGCGSRIPKPCAVKVGL